MRRRLTVLACFLVPLGGCSSKPQVSEGPKFQHPQHGVIVYTDQRYQTAREQCERDVYKQGVDIDGRKVTDPDEALRALVGNLKTQTKDGFDNVEKPAYMARLHELDNLTDDCMTKNGWVKQPVERRPLSASSRRDMLRLHEQGRIKLTPEEVAEMKKGLWYY